MSEEKYLDLGKLVDEIIRKEYPTYDSQNTPLPIRNRIFFLKGRVRFELEQQIRSAVQGLLDELICEVKSIENQGKHIYDDYYSGLRDGYLIAIKIIKKYFPDEVRKNEK